jgi:hypothetical protein
MTDYAIIYDTTTGTQIGNYMGPDGTTAIQTLPPGATYMLVPVDLWVTPVSIPAVQAHICTQIDAGADTAASSLITLSPRRVQTAIAIKEECDTYVAGTSTDSKFPFLSALATANGTTLAQEQTTFLTEYAAMVPPGALINATAEAAKRKVSAATNLAEIAQASQINWPAVMATLTPASKNTV